MSTTALHRATLTIAAAGMLTFGPSALAADNYPDKPIRMIVPYAAGGGPDVLARRTAEALAKTLNGNVVVENKVGAGGILAAEFLTRAPADGYTLMLGASSHVVQKIMQPSVHFDPITDFTHIVQGGSLPQVLIVRADAPFKSAQELIDAAKKAKHPLNFASGGIGSAAHLAGAAFTSAAQIKTLHIPYRGSVEIVPSLLRGDVEFAFPVLATALPQIADGKIRALAVTSEERLPQLPDAPTLNELFHTKDLALDAWSGYWAPKGLPADITAKLETAFKQVFAMPEVKAFYDQAGSPLHISESPAAFTRFMEDETAKYRKIIEENDIKIDG